VACVLLSTLAALAQLPNDYVDMYVAKVKPDRASDFEALAKMAAEVNRRNNGDTWIVLQPMYGEHGLYYFGSARKDLAAIESGMTAFEQAMGKALGEAGSRKTFQDWYSCLESSRGELRRRRFDLAMNAPKDPGAAAKMIGGAKWLRITTVRVRPGKASAFEALLKDIKAAVEKSGETTAFSISQLMSGQPGTVYFVAVAKGTLGEYDSIKTLPEILGVAGYTAFEKSIAELVFTSETTYYRIVPGLSNPPDEIAAVAPDFWNKK
jgi:hypothetical protein